MRMADMHSSLVSLDGITRSGSMGLISAIPAPQTILLSVKLPIILYNERIDRIVCCILPSILPRTIMKGNLYRIKVTR